MRLSIVITLMLAVLFGSGALAADVLTADKARDAALSGEVVLIDIRTPEEWADSGVADVAHTLNMHGKGFVVKLKELMDANPGKPLAMICATGARSTYLTTALEQRGIEVLNVREGMFGSQTGPGWLARSLPTRKPGDPIAIE